MSPGSRKLISAIGIGGLCLVLGAVILLHGQTSLVSRGPNAGGLLKGAWDTVNDAKASPEALERAETRARVALRREPLNTNAAALIGTLRAREGRTAEAEALMTLASSINHRENIADLWLFQAEMARRDYTPAMLHADALLRREIAFTQTLFPALAQATGDPASLAPLAERLAKSPSWRPSFIYLLIDGHPNPAGAFGLLSAIESAKGEVTPAELSTYLNRLVAAREYDQAYLAWILFMPDDLSGKVAYVYDGNFENLPDTRPFGWELESGSVEPPPGHDDDALLVRYDGMSTRRFPTQLIVLPPGRYRFTGEVMTETPDTAGAVEWRITCNGMPTPLLTAPAPQAEQWKTFEEAFTVPAECRSQHLTMVGRVLDRRTDIRAWYDKLNIEPLPGGGP